MREGEPEEPDTDWQPTVCYVGDMKQSIYAFRQAEVAGFRQFANRLRAINRHEFEHLSELTKADSTLGCATETHDFLTMTIVRAWN